MSDENQAGEGQDVDLNKNGAGAGEGAGADASGAGVGAEGSSGAEGGRDAEAAGMASDWPDDWREKLAGQDEKLLSRLKRFQSPANVMRSWLEADQKISKGQLRKALPENASPEELADFRKSNGIPEAPEGYEFRTPEGVELSDVDKADIGDFLKEMHAENASPALVQRSLDAYFAIRAKAEQQMYEAAQEKTLEQKAEVRAEWGRDFERNVRLGNQHLVQAVGEDQAQGFMALTLADGTKLGDNPAFLRYIVAQALNGADDEALATAEFDRGGASIDEQYRAAIDLQFTDAKAYHSKEHQAKLMKLAAAKSKRAA